MKKIVWQISKAGLLVGTLDILAAFLYYFIRTGNSEAFNVLKYVASGFWQRSDFRRRKHDRSGASFSLLLCIFLHRVFLLVVSAHRMPVLPVIIIQLLVT